MSNLEKCSDSGQKTLVFLILLGVIISIFSPLITNYFLHHDDYYYFVWQKEHWQTHPQFKAFILYGRPIGDLIVLGEGSLIRHVADANLVRFMNVILLTIVAFLVYLWCRLNKMSPPAAFCLALLICFLPRS